MMKKSYNQGNAFAKKDPTERKTNRFYFSATDAEAERLRESARSAGFKVQEFIKAAALACCGDSAAPRKRDLADE